MIRIGTASSARLRDAAELALYALAYFFAYQFGMTFSQATASPFWFPDTVLLCALLLKPPRTWWIVVLTPLPIRLFADVSQPNPLWFLLATFAIDASKGLAIAWALRRWIAHPTRLEGTRDFLRYGLVAVLIVPAAAAFGGAAARSGLGHPYWESWESWFLGNALAHLVITPAALYWLGGQFRLAPRRSLDSRVELGLLLGVLTLVSWAVFETTQLSPDATNSRLIVPVLLLFWIAVRFGMLGASVGVAVFSVFAVSSAVRQVGTFSGGSPGEIARDLEQFLALRVLAVYLVAVVVDEMKRVEVALRESEGRFRRMADNAPVLIWKADLEGRLTFVNRVWLEFTGATFDSAIGERLVSSVQPEESERLSELLRTSVMERTPFNLECRLRCADGEFRWVIMAGTPSFSESEELRGLIGTCVDTTAQKELELERQRSLSEFAHVTRVATVGELSGAVAHELRQPLSAILSNAAAAERFLDADPQDLGEVREALRDIRQDDKRAAEILQRMRTLLEKHEIARRPVALEVLVEEIFHLVSIEASERRVRMTLESFGSPLVVSGDRVHLQQVVMNLVLNGFDSMAAVPASARRLTVRTAPAGDRQAEIVVVDTGPGIPAERLPFLFERFWTTKQHGLGMGLSISRSIVEAHGGRIWAEETPGAGATFRVTLPLLETGAS